MDTQLRLILKPLEHHNCRHYENNCDGVHSGKNYSDLVPDLCRHQGDPIRIESETPRTSQRYGVEGFKENFTTQWYPGIQGEYRSAMVLRGLRGTFRPHGKPSRFKSWMS